MNSAETVRVTDKDPIRFEVQRPTPPSPRHTGDYLCNKSYTTNFLIGDSNVFSVSAEDARWDASLVTIETRSGSTYAEFIIQIDDSPIDSATSDPPLHPGGMDTRCYSDNIDDSPIDSATSDPPLHPSGMDARRYSDNIDDSPIDSATSDPPPHSGDVDVRRYSDNISDRHNAILIRRSVSHQDIHRIPTGSDLYPYLFYDNAPGSSLDCLSPPEVSESADSYPESFGWDTSQMILQQTVQTAPPSPDSQYFSPLSYSSSPSELSPVPIEPTRGRSPAVHCHSPYTGLRSASRVIMDMSHSLITGTVTSPGLPCPPYQQYFVASDNLLERDPRLPELNSFEDVINSLVVDEFEMPSSPFRSYIPRL